MLRRLQTERLADDHHDRSRVRNCIPQYSYNYYALLTILTALSQSTMHAYYQLNKIAVYEAETNTYQAQLVAIIVMYVAAKFGLRTSRET